MKIVIILLMGFYSFAANAADNQPTPANQCSTTAKGCTSNSIDAKCSIMACKAEGCGGDYDSGDCKTLNDTHKASCELASKDCGETLPKSIRFSEQEYGAETQGLKVAPTGTVRNKVNARTKKLETKNSGRN